MTKESKIQSLLNSLLRRKEISIPKPSEVGDYLLHYPDMTDMVLLICKKASERFGIHTLLSLEVYHDPDIEDEYLTLYVRPQHYDDSVVPRIKEIRQEYEKMLAGKSGWVLLTTDFQPSG